MRPADLPPRAAARLVDTGADSVQSYSPVGKHHPFWTCRVGDDGRVAAWQENDVFRRQDLPPAFIPDGGVIAVRRDSLFQVDPEHPHAFLGRDRRGVLNEAGAVIDVDDEIDLLVAEAILERRMRTEASSTRVGAGS
jgi:CMP-N-acetylneuraminic acid synthetase